MWPRVQLGPTHSSALPTSITFASNAIRAVLLALARSQPAARLAPILQASYILKILQTQLAARAVLKAITQQTPPTVASNAKQAV